MELPFSLSTLSNNIELVLQKAVTALFRRDFWFRVLGGVFALLKVMPGTSAIVKREQSKAQDMVVQFVRSATDDTGTQRFRAIPEKGLKKSEILDIVSTMKEKQVAYSSGRAFGGIYHYDEEHSATLDEVYRAFASSNALYPGIFPGLKKFESEVVQMSATLFGGDAQTCGTMTSGGTESLIMAVKVYREYAKETKGITRPEIILPVTVHPAASKGAHYMGVKVVTVPVNERFEADVNAIRAAITRNTVAIFASAPQFPHGTRACILQIGAETDAGVLDPIEEIGQIALSKNIPLHVDSCLGGYLLPWLRKLGYLKKDFDFRVPGVTSLSADLHKYGFTHKGASVILYKNAELRKHQYFAATDWPGGLYCSPSMGGSRPGGIIAAAWASLVYLGEDGFMKTAKEVQEAWTKLCDGIRSIPELYIVGDPVSCIVAFASKSLNILQVADVMEKMGWDVPRMQRPICVHVPIGTRQIPVMDAFVADLRKAVEQVRDHPQQVQEGMAGVYGMAGMLPDRGIVSDILEGYMNALYTVPEDEQSSPKAGDK